VAQISEVVANLDSESRRHIISISGGKDSAALAVYIWQKYPQIHAKAEYVFCDTMVELPETDEYIERLEALLGVKVNRVNAFAILGVKPKPGRTPFDIYLRELYGDFLPSPRSRWSRLKNSWAIPRPIVTLESEPTRIGTDTSPRNHRNSPKNQISFQCIRFEMTVSASPISSRSWKSPGSDSPIIIAGVPVQDAIFASISALANGSV
jgi:hypothetical protein